MYFQDLHPELEEQECSEAAPLTENEEKSIEVSEPSPEVQNLKEFSCGSPCGIGLNLNVQIPSITLQSEPISTTLINPVQSSAHNILEHGSINLDLEMVDFEMIDKVGSELDETMSRRTTSSSKRFKRRFCIPVHILNSFRFLPTEKEVSESVGEKEKFTKIDTRSRIIFPFFFSFVMCLYVLLYTYVVVDNTDYVEEE